MYGCNLYLRVVTIESLAKGASMYVRWSRLDGSGDEVFAAAIAQRRGRSSSIKLVGCVWFRSSRSRK